MAQILESYGTDYLSFICVSYYQDGRTALQLTPDTGISKYAYGEGVIIPPARVKRSSQYSPVKERCEGFLPTCHGKTPGQ